jgi:hypothetical protein
MQGQWLTDVTAKGKMAVMLSVDQQRGVLLGLSIGGDAVDVDADIDFHATGRMAWPLSHGQ